MRLFPCAPKAPRFLAHSDHPHRATIKVAAKSAEGGESTPEAKEFHLNPEFKLPDLRGDASAVAEAAAGAEAAGYEGGAQAAVAAKSPWAWTGEESLYPYWAVTRLSSAEMRKLQAEKETSTARFNMMVIQEEFANVTVGCDSRNMTLHVTVPVTTNAVALRTGDKLYLEMVAKAKPEKRKAETWRTDASKAKAPKHVSDGPQCTARGKG